MDEKPPTVLSSSTMEIMGFTLTTHVLSNMERVIEINEEFERLMDHMGFEVEHGDDE